jgi:hypothetical protein
MIDLQAIFGDGTATVAKVATIPKAVDTAADPQIGTRFADWVRRPDCHGRMGWESPDLSEIDRWWARCDFDDLPEVPVGFTIGEIPETAPRIDLGCVAGGIVDMLDPKSKRPLQGDLRALRARETA